MTETRNPYAPPKSAVVDSVATNDAYFSVGTVKLSLMAFTTFGVYVLYWFYRNWKVIRQRNHLPISPFWRAFFAPLWSFSLGKRFEADAKERNISIGLPVATFGILYLVLSALGRLPEPYSLISLFSFIPIVPFDRAARRLNGNGILAEPTHGRYSAWNIAWLVLGAVLVILAVIGSFRPDGVA